jgi:hypothetical protein
VTRAGQLPVRYVRFTPEQPTPDTLHNYVGSYINDEFGSLFQVAVADGQLRLLGPIGPASTLQPTTKDRFTLGGAGIVFERGAKGRVERLMVSHPRARKTIYRRMAGDHPH